MKGGWARATLNLFLPSVLLIGGATSAVSLWLQSSGPLWPAILIGLVLSLSIEVLDGLRRPGLWNQASSASPRVPGVVRWGAAVLVLVTVCVLAAQAVIVPLGAYIVWFDLAHSGEASGAVSYVFVLFTAMFAGAAATALPRRPRLAFGVLSAWGLLLASLVLPSQPLFFASAAALVLAFIPSGNPGSRFDRAAATRGLAVMVFAAVLGLGAGTIVEPGGSSLIDGTLAPALRTMVLNVYPRFPLVADVPGYGYRLESRDLGGRPLLSSAELYELEGPANTRLYMRSRVFRRYTGSSWEAATRGEATGSGEATTRGDAKESGEHGPPGAPGEAADISLTVVSDFVAEAAHTLDTVSVIAEPEQGWDYAELSYGFVTSSPMPRGTDIALFEDERARRRDPALPEEADYWLELPDDLPERVVRLGTQLTAESPTDTVSAIRSELFRGAEYTLSPSSRDQSDVVASFLETRAGYCVHFASAFTVLARVSGLPARYVTGHLARTDSQGRATISGLKSHAWSEVWFDGQWHVVEATPPMLATAGDDGRRDSVFGLSYGSTLREELAAEQVAVRGGTHTSTQLRAILGDLAPDRTRDRSGIVESLSRFAVPFIVSLSGVLILAMARALILRAVAREDRYREAGPLSKELTRVVRASLFAADPRIRGWSAWRATAGRGGRGKQARLRGAHLDRVVKLALTTTFGTRQAVKRDSRYLRKVARYLRHLHKRGRK